MKKILIFIIYIFTDWRTITEKDIPRKGKKRQADEQLDESEAGLPIAQAIADVEEGIYGNEKKSKKERERKRNLAAEREQERFYDELKNSCVPERNLPNEYEKVIQSDPAANKNNILDNIYKISQIIKFNKTRSIQFITSLGQEFVLFKRSITNCTVCENQDEFEAMACAVCIRKKIIKTFYHEINQTIGYRETQIRVFIRLAKLAKMCPKFKQTSLCLGKIKKHLTFLFKKMEQDKDWWQ